MSQIHCSFCSQSAELNYFCYLTKQKRNKAVANIPLRAAWKCHKWRAFPSHLCFKEFCPLFLQWPCRLSHIFTLCLFLINIGLCPSSPSPLSPLSFSYCKHSNNVWNFPLTKNTLKKKKFLLRFSIKALQKFQQNIYNIDINAKKQPLRF